MCMSTNYSDYEKQNEIWENVQLEINEKGFVKVMHF